MRKLRLGVAPLVLIFNTVEHAGVQEVEEKDPMAPEGNPKIPQRSIYRESWPERSQRAGSRSEMTGVTV